MATAPLNWLVTPRARQLRLRGEDALSPARAAGDRARCAPDGSAWIEFEHAAARRHARSVRGVLPQGRCLGGGVTGSRARSTSERAHSATGHAIAI